MFEALVMGLCLLIPILFGGIMEVIVGRIKNRKYAVKRYTTKYNTNNLTNVERQIMANRFNER